MRQGARKDQGAETQQKKEPPPQDIPDHVEEEQPKNQPFLTSNRGLGYNKGAGTRANVQWRVQLFDGGGGGARRGKGVPFGRRPHWDDINLVVLLGPSAASPSLRRSTCWVLGTLRFVVVFQLSNGLSHCKVWGRGIPIQCEPGERGSLFSNLDFGFSN